VISVKIFPGKKQTILQSPISQSFTWSR